MNVTAKNLRLHSKELLDSVTRGEEVVITFRGKPCAKLGPFSETARNKEEDELFGIWKDHETGNYQHYTVLNDLEIRVFLP